MSEVHIGDRVFVLGHGVWATVRGFRGPAYGGPVTGVRVLTEAQVELVVDPVMMLPDGKYYGPRVVVDNTKTDLPCDVGGAA